MKRGLKGQKHIGSTVRCQVSIRGAICNDPMFVEQLISKDGNGVAIYIISGESEKVCLIT